MRFTTGVYPDGEEAAIVVLTLAADLHPHTQSDHGIAIIQSNADRFAQVLVEHCNDLFLMRLRDQLERAID